VDWPSLKSEPQLDVYWIQQFWFDDFLESDGNLQRSYLTIDGFGTRNVAVTAQLNVVAPGASIAIDDGKISGDLGTAAVGIKWYEYVDDEGFHHVDTEYFVPHAIIHDCVGFQLEFAYRRIWAGATGTVLYFND
jgi:hypothetical protein